MFNLEFFDKRKQELTEVFENAQKEIQGIEASLKEKHNFLAVLRGSYAENESNITQLKKHEEARDGEVIEQAAQENSI